MTTTETTQDRYFTIMFALLLPLSVFGATTVAMLVAGAPLSMIGILASTLTVLTIVGMIVSFKRSA